MRRLELTAGGVRYRIELHDDVLTMSQLGAGGWDEIARLTVAAATVLASLDAGGRGVTTAPR